MGVVAEELILYGAAGDMRGSPRQRGSGRLNPAVMISSVSLAQDQIADSTLCYIKPFSNLSRIEELLFKSISISRNKAFSWNNDFVANRNLIGLLSSARMKQDNQNALHKVPMHKSPA